MDNFDVPLRLGWARRGGGLCSRGQWYHFTLLDQSGQDQVTRCTLNKIDGLVFSSWRQLPADLGWQSSSSSGLVSFGRVYTAYLLRMVFRSSPLVEASASSWSLCLTCCAQSENCIDTAMAMEIGDKRNTSCPVRRHCHNEAIRSCRAAPLLAPLLPQRRLRVLSDQFKNGVTTPHTGLKSGAGARSIPILLLYMPVKAWRLCFGCDLVSPRTT